MPTRLLPLIAVLLCACAPTDDGIPGSEVSYTEERAPCRDRDPLRRLFFGDLHVHTRNSWDAYGYHLAVDPDGSYAFARGVAVELPALEGGARQAQLDRPLDFAAVTDHAEFLGETRLCTRAGSAVYDTPACASFRERGESAVTAWAIALVVREGTERRSDLCGADGKRCLDAAREVWQEVGAAAEQTYDRTEACSFVSFIGYEHTATPMATNMHRNVLFRTDRVIDLPLSFYEAPEPVDLWQGLEGACQERTTGCDVMVIPHNMNMSNGNMFVSPDDAGVAQLRARMEPVLELFQHKGDQECRTDLGGAVDPDCAFEKERPPPVEDCGGTPGWGGMNSMGCVSRRDYLRGILLAGMTEHDRLGLDPFRLGVIGSTDTHNGTAGHTLERGWPGHVGTADDTPAERLGSGNTTHRGLVNNPGGLAAVWAVERSRDALFEAIRRREVYATSGTRIQVRLFGGWDLPDAPCDAPGWVETGYREGVPMGGILPERPDGAAGPRFIVRAERDPGTPASPGALLQQVQIVKGWIDGAGTSHDQVLTVAGDPSQGSLEPTTCETDGAGATQLCALWQDDAFDPTERAFYYARVLEVPTCRWSTWECHAIPEGQRPEGCTDPSVRPAIQERAWTSAIWYEPR